MPVNGSLQGWPKAYSGLRALAAGGVCLLLSAISLRAQVWDGGASTGAWATATNWNPNSLPGTGAAVTFNAASANSQWTITLANTSRSVASVTFSSALNGQGFTFNAGTATLTISGAAGITNNDTATQTFNLPINVTGAQTWNAASGGITVNNVLLANTLTLSGTAAIALNGTVTLSAARIITNNGTGGVTINNITGSNRTLTMSGTGDTAISGVISTGSGALVKTGSGTVTLSGANTYTGATTISAGILNIQNNTALGTTASGTTVAATNAALQIQNGITVTGETLTLSGTGVASGGALESVSGANTWAGTVTLSAASRINSDAGTLTISGPVSGAAALTVGGAGTTAISGVVGIGTGTLTKDGTGTLVLSGTNTYSGATTISAGVLNIQNNKALGTTTGATTVAANAALQLQNGITVTSEALTLNGTGVSNDGALRNVSGANTWTGAITLGSASRINSDAGTLTISGAIGGSGQNLTVGGAGTTQISGVIGTGTGSLTMDGSGTLTLSGVNTYTGATAVNAGTLSAGVNNALSNSTAVTVANSATYNLNNFTDTVGSIAGAGNITLGSGTLTSGGDGTSTTFSGVVSGTGNLAKSGAGTLVLSGANTYSGATTVSGGVLNIQNNSALGTGAGGVTVASGATLALQGGITNNVETLTISGTGVGGIGALNNASGANNWQGAVNLGASASIVNSDTNLLTIGDTSYTQAINLGANTLTFGGPGDIWLNSQIGGTGGVTMTGSGTLTFYGLANSYTGATTVNNGTLVVDTYVGDPQQGIVGNLTIGDGSGAASSAVVRFGQGATPNASDLISHTSAVSINTDGLLDLNNQDETIGSLSMTGGQVSTGNGHLILNGDVTGNASTSQAVINGYVNLNGANRNFTIASQSASSTDMAVNAIVQNGSLTKAGAGRLALTGANTYNGTTTVSAGVLNISNSLALGGTGGGTVVNSGAALEIQGGISVGTEALTLNGTGVSNGGALRNVSGNNSWAGNLALASASRVNADAGTLTLAGGVNSSNFGLTVGGAGNTAITGSLGLGSGSLTKDGTGTLYLSGNNVYTGGTSVSSGVVNISNAYALGGPSGGATTVASGAALQLQGGIAVGTQALILNGTGISNNGALRNVSGNNSWSGPITLASATRVNSDAGTLTLSGSVGGAGQNLTVGGAGNTVISGAISTTTGSLTKDGTGTLTLAGSNTNTGGVNVSAGTLALGASERIADSSTVTVSSGATFNLNGYTETIGGLSGAGTLQLASGTLIVGSGNASSTFSGAFAGGDTGTFEKTGTGTFTLGAGMSFSGGNLVLNGGTFGLGGFNSTFNSLTVTANSTLDFGGTSIINLSSVVVNSGVTLTVTNWTDTIDYFYSTTNPGSGNLGRIVFSPGYTGADTKWQSWDTQITPVPEPTDYGVLLIGFGLLVVAWRRLRPQRLRG
jgi:fibronectin-binding autotransporter adhesin